MSGFLYDGWMILAALLPSIGLLFLFWVILKHIVEGDRRERAALREERLRREAEVGTMPASRPQPNAPTEDGSHHPDPRG